MKDKIKILNELLQKTPKNSDLHKEITKKIEVLSKDKIIEKDGNIK